MTTLRPSMQEIINILRQYGSAATDDEFEGETFWNDLQLQQIADRNARRGIIKVKRVDPASTIYRVNAPTSLQLEDDLAVYDMAESPVATAFTYNPDTSELTFAAPLSDDTYTVFGLGISINEALADLWQAKADQRFNYIDWKAQNNKMNMAQEYQHCVERAVYYRNKRFRTFDRKGRGKWFQ